MSELDTLRKYESRLVSRIESKQGDARDHAERLLRIVRERIDDYEEATNG